MVKRAMILCGAGAAMMQRVLGKNSPDIDSLVREINNLQHNKPMNWTVDKGQHDGHQTERTTATLVKKQYETALGVWKEESLQLSITTGQNQEDVFTIDSVGENGTIIMSKVNNSFFAKPTKLKGRVLNRYNFMVDNMDNSSSKWIFTRAETDIFANDTHKKKKSKKLNVAEINDHVERFLAMHGDGENHTLKQGAEGRADTYLESVREAPQFDSDEDLLSK